MIWTLRDVKLTEMSLEDLKNYARECAGLDNQVRAWHISVQFEIIKRVNKINEAERYEPVKIKERRKPEKGEILFDDDDDFSIVRI